MEIIGEATPAGSVSTPEAMPIEILELLMFRLPYAECFPVCIGANTEARQLFRRALDSCLSMILSENRRTLCANAVRRVRNHDVMVNLVS